MKEYRDVSKPLVGQPGPTSSQCIPLEMQEAIVKCLSSQEYWPDFNSLANCALTCHALRRVAIKGLYQRVEVLGKIQHRSLELTLRKEEFRSRVHTLSVHDVTPEERVSHVALHGLPPQLTRLFIFGPQIPDKNTFPIHPTLFANLSQHHSVRFLQIQQINMNNLNELRRLLGNLPGLESAILRNVSWKTSDATFRPLFNATSWRLSQISLSECSSDFIAPFLWARPPRNLARTNQRQLRRMNNECHPPLWEPDVVPIVELATFVLGIPENSSTKGPICWEWGKTDVPNRWYLECCVDEIDASTNLAYVRFHLVDPFHTPLTPDRGYIFAIDICIEEPSGIALDRLDELLRGFQNLETLDLRSENGSDLQMIAKLLAAIGSPSVRMHINGYPCDVQITSISPKPWSPDKQQPKRLCCARIKNETASHRLVLSQSLARLYAHFRRRGLPEGELEVLKQHIKVKRELAKSDAIQYHPDLARLLQIIRTSFYSLGYLKQALEHSKEAVEIGRQLASRDPAAFDSLLAALLHERGVDFKGVGRREDAVASYLEAIDIRRKLAIQDPGAYDSVLADSLHRAGSELSKQGAHERALVFNKEAVETRRRLCIRDPEAFYFALSDSLHRVGTNLDNLGHIEDSLGYHEEAAEIRRSLPTRDFSKSVLAKSLSAVARSLSRLDRHLEAVKLYQEVVSIKLTMRMTNQSLRELSSLANSLHTTAFELSNVGRHEEALTFYTEAIGIRRRLASQNGGWHKVNSLLANTLHKAGASLCNLGRHEEALEYHEEATRIRRILSVYGHQLKDSNALANSLHTVGLALYNVGRFEETFDREAIGIRRDLASKNPDLYNPLLAKSLRVMWARLFLLGRHEKEAAVLDELARVERNLPSSS